MGNRRLGHRKSVSRQEQKIEGRRIGIPLGKVALGILKVNHFDERPQVIPSASEESQKALQLSLRQSTK
jgi:hypothetical protein